MKKRISKRAEGWSYARSGVDLRKVGGVHGRIVEILSQTFESRRGREGEVLSSIGHYAGLIDIGGGRALALHVDGVGTKVLVAQLMGRYDSVGVDCVAMCVNDLVCMGAEPLALIDYLALEKPEGRMVEAIMRGLAEGAKDAGVAVVGGETATMPDVIKGAVRGRGFDLAALCVGVVEKEKVVYGDRMKPGDVVLGLESSGIHSNGLTLARKVLLEKGGLTLRSKPPQLGGLTLGGELLRPTRIYSKLILNLLGKVEIHGLAHITGGAFTKLKRFREYAQVGFHFDNLPPPQPIFTLMQRMGRIAPSEMYKTFNMGVGFCVVTSPRDLETAVRVCEGFGVKASRIGRLTDSTEIKLELESGEEFSL